MGDMADFALEHMMDIDELADRYSNASTAELYEVGLVDELGYYIGGGFSHYRPKPRTCRCCGKSNLYWKQIKGKWRLFQDGKIHDCPVNPLIEEYQR